MDGIHVTQQPSLSVADNTVECMVGSGPTSGELFMYSKAITIDR